MVHAEGKTADDRARELYTTGVPFPFKVEFSKKVANPAKEEARIHAFLSDKRPNNSREFFRTTPDYVRKVFDLIEGDMCVEEEQDEVAANTIAQQRSMTQVFIDGQRIRHVIGSDPNKTWTAVYNGATDKIICNEVSYTSLSNFAVKHHRIYRPDHQSANGWVECECEVGGEWVTAESLRT
jgi:hypothetical protein